MTWRTHLVGGISSLWLVVAVSAVTTAVVSAVTGSSAIPPAAAAPSQLESSALLVTAAALGSMLPDLDAVDSGLRHLNFFENFEPFALPGVAIPKLFGHRGFMHSAQGIAACAFVLALPSALVFGWQAGVGLVLGYSSHIALDACTKTGVPLWYPSRRRFWLLPPHFCITTGSPEEDAFLAIFAVLALLVLLASLRQMMGV